jgi:hypothetical protein
MFHQEVIDYRLHYIQKGLSFRLKRYSVEESTGRTAKIPEWNKRQKAPEQPLTQEQLQFIANEMILCTWDFNYWITRYSRVIAPEGRKVLMKLWESQEIGMKHIALGEKRAWKEHRANGWVWLKARQLGATQLAQNIMLHRLGFHAHQRGAIASDAPTPTARLLRRFTGVLDNLPYWMKPSVSDRVKTDEGEAIFFDELNSSLIIGHGRKMGGGIAQGDSTNVFHFTELPDWQNFKQIDADFLPTFHALPNNVGIIESTARSRRDNFHDLFQRAWDGNDTKLSAMFIPYYAHATLYRLAPPDGWTPNKITLEHIAKVEKQSPGYCHGRTVRLSKRSAYWWETEYTNAARQKKKSMFLSEYASDHYEAFQHQSIGMFSGDLIESIERRALARGYDLFHLPSH